MSTPRSEQRKSASFKQESFEQEWAKLAEAARKAEAKQKPSVPKLELRSVTDPDGMAKTQEKSAWKANTSVPSLSLSTTTTQTITTTQTDTTDHTQSMSHSAPVVTPRKQLRFASGSDAISDSPREKNSPRAEKTTDSPRRNQVRSKESSRGLKVSGSSATSTPTASPAVTPREKNEVESPRSLKSAQLRKNISKKFSKVALDLSKLGEKITAERHSPPSSLSSAGRVSPSKTTPRKKESAFIKSLPYAVRNSAAKCLMKLQQDDDFKNAGPARKKLMLNAKMIDVLSENGIKYDKKNLESLVIDAENRLVNHEIDMKIDLSEEPYHDFINGQFKYWEKIWLTEGSNTSGIQASGFDRGTIYNDASSKEKKNMDLCFSPRFLRDLASGVLTFSYQDKLGEVKEFNSLEEFETFLNEDDAESMEVKRQSDPWRAEADNKFLRSKYITHFSSQNVSNVVGTIAFGIDPNLPSHVKLYDGTPIIPKGDVQISYVFRKTSDGGIEVQVSYEIKPNPAKESNLKNGGFTRTDPEAVAIASLSLRFSKDRDFEISPLRLMATGWNLPLEKKKFSV